MSVFDNAKQWPDLYKACGAPHQSPVNLSRSFALPCDRLCEWKIDEVAIQNAIIQEDQKKSGGLTLTSFSTGTPTARFNGEGYTCQKIVLFSTSQHSVENIFGEAELVAYFTNPKGFTICMSVLVRSNPGDTPSSQFFNAFVPYIDSNGARITLGDTWSLANILPEVQAFYVYEGTDIVPNCKPDVTWIVYANAVSMDPSDYARLASRMRPKRRELQEVADRQVFYNSGAQLTGKPIGKKDGKIYMRCKRVPRENEEQEEKNKIKKAPIGEQIEKQAGFDAELAKQNGFFMLWILYMRIGGFWAVMVVLTQILLTVVLFFLPMGKDIAKGLFDMLYYVPGLVHSLIFG
jgi:carbonic anhydrase